MTAPVRRMAVNVAAWLGGAMVSVGVGVAALSQINPGLANDDEQLLHADAVTSAVPDSPTAAGATPPRRRQPGKPTTAEPAPGRDTPVPRLVERGFTSPGGSVVARCVGDQVYLVSWSPAPGYHAEQVERGPADTAQVTFESDERKVTVAVGCVAGVPQLATGRRDAGEDPPED